METSHKHTYLLLSILLLHCLLVDKLLAEDGPGVGFPLGVVERSTLARLQKQRGKYRLAVVPKGRVFEVLPITQGLQQMVFLWNERLAWLPVRAIERLGRSYQLPPDRLKLTAQDVLFEPIHDLPPGIGYYWLYKEGAKLHVCTIDLDVNSDLEFLPYASPYFSHIMTGDEKRNTILTFARRVSAIVGINGTFFMTGPEKRRGEPLGNVIIRGKVAFELTLVDVLERNRAYFCWTDKGRAVLGETSYPASVILDLNESDDFDPERFKKGERVQSMIGGLGWLVRNGRPDAWEDGVEGQFGARYYSYKIRRPQTIIGLSKGGKKVTFLSQEGYPHSRRRMTLPELAHLMASLGCEFAAFTDGGGSTEMVVDMRPVVRTENMKRRRLNSTALLVRPGKMTLGAISGDGSD